MTPPRAGRGHRAYRRKREALKRRVIAEGLVCTWCGPPTDTTLPAKHSMCFTADHPKALKACGHMVAQELEPMHLRCNSTKNDSADMETWSAS